MVEAGKGLVKRSREGASGGGRSRAKQWESRAECV